MSRIVTYHCQLASRTTYEMIIPFTMACGALQPPCPGSDARLLWRPTCQSRGFLALPETILAVAETLVDALDIDTVCTPLPVVDLVPSDKKWCVCGCTDLTVSSHSAQGTLVTSRTVRKDVLSNLPLFS